MRGLISDHAEQVKSVLYTGLYTPGNIYNTGNAMCFSLRSAYALNRFLERLSSRIVATPRKAPPLTSIYNILYEIGFDISSDRRTRRDASRVTKAFFYP